MITAVAFVIGLVAGFIGYVAVSPADAHTERHTQGNDWAEIREGYSCDVGADSHCRQYHRKAVTADVECDSHASGVIVRFGDGTTNGFADEDGCNGSAYALSFTKNIAEFKVCEASSLGQWQDRNFLGCTQYKNVDPYFHDVYWV
jgi:hypothetical protein